MTTFTPALLEPWQSEIAALYKQLAIDIAEVHERQATETRLVQWQHLCHPSIDLINIARNKP